MKKTLLLTAVLLFLVAFSVSALSYVNVDNYVVVAGGPGSTGYSTSILLTYPFDPTIQTGSASTSLPSESFDFATCFLPLKVILNPLDNVVLHGAENVQCQAFSVIKVSKAFTNITSLITYKNGKDFAYLAVPSLPLALSKVGDKFDIWGILNDGETTTDLAFFNVDSQTSSVRIQVFEGQNYITTESLSLSPGLTFYRLKTKVSAGKLVLVGGSGVGPDTDPKVVGFAAIGKTGAPRVLPFTPK